MLGRQGDRPSLLKKVAIIAAAIIVSALLLPATIMAWYYADSESLYSAVSFAAEVTDPRVTSLGVTSLGVTSLVANQGG